MKGSYKAIDAQVKAVETEIHNLSNRGRREDQTKLQRLYLKRERLQERSFRAFQKSLARRP